MIKGGKATNFHYRAHARKKLSYFDVNCTEKQGEMTKRGWKTKIKKACEEAGTYKKFFDYAIDTLAGILEKRDEAAQILEDEEESLIIEQTNKGGFTNKVKNPAFSVWDDLNKSALTYWRDLGLTPAGFKRLNEQAFDNKADQDNENILMKVLQQKKE